MEYLSKKFELASKTIFRIKTKFVGHNIKFDYLILRKHGMRLRNIYFDTMLAAGECFGDWEFFNLGEVARRLLGTKIKRYSDIIEKEQTFLDVPFKDLVEHACTDADMSLRLFHRLSVELRNRQLEDRFLSDRMRMLATLAEMECEGVRIDVKKIEMSINRLLEDADALKKLIFQEAGCEFDLDSREATSDALRKVEALREWITSRSLTQSGMEQLAWRHRLVELIVKHRRVRKRLRELDAIRNGARRGKVFPLFSQLRVPHMKCNLVEPKSRRSIASECGQGRTFEPRLPEPKASVAEIAADHQGRSPAQGTNTVVRDRISSAPGSHCLKVWNMQMYYSPLPLAFRIQRCAVVSLSALRRR